MGLKLCRGEYRTVGDPTAHGELSEGWKPASKCAVGELLLSWEEAGRFVGVGSSITQDEEVVPPFVRDKPSSIGYGVVEQTGVTCGVRQRLLFIL